MKRLVLVLPALVLAAGCSVAVQPAAASRPAPSSSARSSTTVTESRPSVPGLPSGRRPSGPALAGHPSWPASVPPAPAPAPEPHYAPTAPHYAPLRPTARPSAPPAAPVCRAGEEWQYGFGCVAVQLPDETQGRAYG